MTLPTRAELMRRRRCRLLVVGMVLGALLPIFQWSWITLAIGLGGVAAPPARLPARMCAALPRRIRHESDTHPRGPEA